MEDSRDLRGTGLLQSMAANARRSRLEQLSERTPEKRTVIEKRDVNITPETRPYLLDVKPGMSTDIM